MSTTGHWDRRTRGNLAVAGLFILPNFLGFVTFVAFPVLFSLYMSFTNWTPMPAVDLKWVGWANYVDLLKDRDFWFYFYNTFYLMLGMPIAIMGSLFLAFNLHPCWNTTYASRPFAQFMTRYSSLLWSVDIKRVDAPQTFQVTSNRELWWEKSAYVKSPDPEGSGPVLYLLHLMNTPTTEKPVWKIPEDPPAASDVEVTFRVPGGRPVAKAWCFRPYEWGEDDRIPVQVELTTKATPGGVQVRLPAFRYYTLVVLQLQE